MRLKKQRLQECCTRRVTGRLLRASGFIVWCSLGISAEVVQFVDGQIRINGRVDLALCLE
jgi:hypothetical protein